jgi:peptidyl-dipeptidase Dcp
MINPLIQPSKLKHAAPPFDAIKTEHFKPAIEYALQAGRSSLAELKAKPASLENTIRGLEQASEELEFVYSIFSNFLHAYRNDELQALAMELGPQVASYSNDIILDPVIFAKVKAVYDQRLELKLSKEQTQLVEKTYQDFERNGAGLNEDQKNRLREIDERLSQLSPTFRDNLLKSTNDFELWIDDEKNLSGLPPSVISAAREAAAAKGRPKDWLFTLQAPSMRPFVQYADNRELREKMVKAFNSRATQDPYKNEPVLREIVKLMHERSQLLGYKTYAHHALKLRMAETPEKVQTFLAKLKDATMAAAQREVQEVQDFANSLGGPKKLEAWDFSYYSEKLKEKRYSIDTESLKPYFSLENVLNGVFKIAGLLYDLKFKKSTEYPVYQKDVEVFEVSRSSGEFMGLFYADFFPRENKSQGAWMTTFRDQGKFRGSQVRPHVSIVCNFSRPTEDTPSLLTFEEVRTLFHEFGHALHALLSRVEHRSLAGTNVFLDFVELPSQIMENWAEEPEALKFFAHHYKTGELIPQELMERLQRSQMFLTGYMAIRQLGFAYLDLAWFLNPPPDSISMDEFEKQVMAPLQLLPPIPGASQSAGFSHIFGGGYASGYYSYKWAEALDADAFELFEERGIFDSQTARKFEEFILSKGGSDHPMELYTQFRGRAPDPEALLRRDGLLGPNNK